MRSWSTCASSSEAAAFNLPLKGGGRPAKRVGWGPATNSDSAGRQDPAPSAPPSPFQGEGISASGTTLGQQRTTKGCCAAPGKSPMATAVSLLAGQMVRNRLKVSSYLHFGRTNSISSMKSVGGARQALPEPGHSLPPAAICNIVQTFTLVFAGYAERCTRDPDSELGTIPGRQRTTKRCCAAPGKSPQAAATRRARTS